MRIQKHKYSEPLSQAAESFLIEQFGSPTQFTEASHLPDLIDAAMHIVTEVAWIQSEGPRRFSYDATLDGSGGADDAEEDEDEES